MGSSTPKSHWSRKRSELELKPRDERHTPLLSPKISLAGISAQHVVMPSGIEYEFAWQGHSHYLALHDFRMRDGETHADDHAVTRRSDVRGKFTFIPAGCRVWGWTAPTRAHSSFVAMYVDPSEVRADIGQRLTQADVRPEVFFSSPRLLASMGALSNALRNEDRSDRLYVESLSLLTVVEYCRYREGQLIIEPALEQVGGVAISRIEEYIDANLSGSIGLDELATVAGLSRFHFLRAFKKAAGETPYQRVLRMRIERAKVLLGKRGASIAEIARQVGFNSASRFIQTFQRISGATPARFADSNKPPLSQRSQKRARSGDAKGAATRRRAID